MVRNEWMDDDSTKAGFPMVRFPNFCFLPAPKAHSVGHVLISQFLLFLHDSVPFSFIFAPHSGKGKLNQIKPN